MSDRQLGFGTLQLHAGQEPDPTTGARAVPIYQTTSFVFKDFAAAKAISSAEASGYDYSRIINPTNEVLENRIAALEGGVGALAVASGSAATATSILNITHAGDEIVSAKTLYGGSFNLFVNTLPKHGIKTTLVDPIDPENFRRAITERTKGLFVETIGNPDINIIDFEAVARIAEESGIPLIIDNTFGTPYLFRPFDYGANISVHSATKYIGGHGTSIGGVIVDGGNFDWEAFPERQPLLNTPDNSYHGAVWARDIKPLGPIAYIIRARVILLRDIGAALSPFNAFQLIQGIETLPLRIERHSANAVQVAHYLSAHPKVRLVIHPALATGRAGELAAKYLARGTGGLVGFELTGGLAAGQAFINALKLFYHVANIGDARSLAIHPASTTHSQLNPEEQAATGVTPGYVRLSIGIEHIDDILADLAQALDAA